MKFLELFTDSKNRPAVELVIGVLLLVPIALYAFGAFGKADNGILGTMLLFDGALFGLNTLGNVLDKGGQ